MDLLTYVRALRRHWFVIAACVVIGALIGYGTTLLNSESATSKKGRTYYKATNTVVIDFSSSQGGIPPTFSNLDQVALVVTTGDVPDAVAAELKTPETGRELGERVVTTTDSLTNTLQITAVDANRDRAAQIADIFATKLDDSLQASDQQRYDTYVQDLTDRVAQFKSQSDDLFAKVRAALPGTRDLDTLQQEYIATQNTYQSRFSQLQNAKAAGPAQTAVTVLQKAEPEPISSNEYATRLDLGATGQNHIRAAGTDAASLIAPGTSSSAFNSGFGRGFVGGFLGLLIGIGLVLLLDRLDRRMRTHEEVEQAFQVPVLAEVPRLSRKDQADDSLVAYSAPLSRVAEAFRAVRTSLVFQQSMLVETTPTGGNGNHYGANGHAAPRGSDATEPLVVMVTSAAPREGKTTTSANLAVAFAEGGASVLVVNCDFRRPTIHRRFGVFDEPRRVQDTKVPGVKIVTNVLADAAANPSQVVAAQHQVIAAARGRFDVIILDTAPMLTANDAVGIASSVDFVLLVAQLDLTTGDNARRVMELLARVHASVSGVVLIGPSDASNEYYYYYQRERVTVKGQSSPDAAQETADDAASPTTLEAVLRDPSTSVTTAPAADAPLPGTPATSARLDPMPIPATGESEPPPLGPPVPRDIFGEPSGSA